MRSRENILVVYFAIIVGIYFLENIIEGNITASNEQDKGKIQLPIIIKKVLFPLFYIKRFTYVIIIYQVFNFCVFIVMIFIGIFGNKDIIHNTLTIYLSIQKYYWWISIILLESYFYIIKLKKSFEIRRMRKISENCTYNILKEMNVQNIEVNGDTLYIKLSSINIKGYIFIIIAEDDLLIPDIDFTEILNNLSEMGYLLIYINKIFSEDIDKSLLTIKETIKYYNVLNNSNQLPVYFVGREAAGIYEMLNTYIKYNDLNIINLISGVICVCISSQKKVMKNLSKLLDKNIFNKLNLNERNFYVISIYKKNSMENLNAWLSKSINH